VMLNARYQMGRAGSLRIGAKAVNRDAEAIVIINVDQPRPADFLRTLVAGHRPESAATRPVHGTHHGHPVVVSGWLRPELLEARDEDGGLHGVLEAHTAEIADLPAEAICEVEFNTPEEYAGARRFFGIPV
jgi:CTP:molybdopterin cytidylyltransferase MocA